MSLALLVEKSKTVSSPLKQLTSILMPLKRAVDKIYDSVDDVNLRGDFESTIFNEFDDLILKYIDAQDVVEMLTERISQIVLDEGTGPFNWNYVIGAGLSRERFNTLLRKINIDIEKYIPKAVKRAEMLIYAGKRSSVVKKQTFQKVTTPPQIRTKAAMYKEEYDGYVDRIIEKLKQSPALRHYILKDLNVDDKVKAFRLFDVVFPDYSAVIKSTSIDAQACKKYFDKQYVFLTKTAVKEDDLSVITDFLGKLGDLAEVIETLLPKLAKQQKMLDKKATAPVTAPMGRIAWPEARPGQPFEPNTKIEDQLYDALNQHFDDINRLTASEAEVLRKMLAKGWYSDVLKAPSVKTVVRGMNVSKQWLQKVLKGEYLDDTGMLERSFTFTPKQGSSSWSTQEGTAKQFAREGDHMWAVVMYASVKRNPNRFLSGPGGLDRKSVV
jgi:hypothetical protein